jgi:hypothetical protein
VRGDPLLIPACAGMSGAEDRRHARHEARRGARRPGRGAVVSHQRRRGVHDRAEVECGRWADALSAMSLRTLGWAGLDWAGQSEAHANRMGTALRAFAYPTLAAISLEPARNSGENGRHGITATRPADECNKSPQSGD